MVDVLEERYASPEMVKIWSEEEKFIGWRRVWVALAQGQHDLGLETVKQEMVDALRANINVIDLARASEIETYTQHDVTAHNRHYQEVAPEAKGIIHTGGTSRDVTDNAELVQVRDSVDLIYMKALNALNLTAQNAEKYKSVMTLARTHFLPAQVTTVGRRFAMWGEHLLSAVEELEYRRSHIKLRGIKGAVGTQTDQAALLKSKKKAMELDEIVASQLGFSDIFKWTGQTYPRLQDYQVLSTLDQVAISCRKIGTDMRLLVGLREFEEPFGEEQVGSSAMAYKRNPTKAERMCSLSRYVLAMTNAVGSMASDQWLEGSVEDSALRRIALQGSFYATDAILELYLFIMQNPTIYEGIVRRNVEEELLFIATNYFTTEAVNKGADRNLMHEKMRQHSMRVIQETRIDGLPNRLIELVASDPEIPLDVSEIRAIMANPDYFIGNAILQTTSFVSAVNSLLKDKDHLLGYKSQVKV